MLPAARKFLLVSAFSFVSLAAFIMLAVKLLPGAEILLFSEDGVIESASATAYAIAAMAGYLALYDGLNNKKDRADRFVLLSIPILGTVCALDEISWGARLFKLHMPAMEQGGEFDGAHDIFIILERLVQALNPTTRALIFGCAALVFVAATYWKRKNIVSYLAWFIDDHARRCFGAAVALLALAVFLDFGHGRYISSLEEFSELSASLFLAAAGGSCRWQSRKGSAGSASRAAATSSEI